MTVGRTMLNTHLGPRPAFGTCIKCRGRKPEGDSSLEAPAGVEPLCKAEDGRLAHFCKKHRPWTFNLVPHR